MHSAPFICGSNGKRGTVINRLDHLVLTVRDIQVSCAFYARVMGMEVVTFGTGRKTLAFGQQKINLHASGKEFSPHANAPTPGSADLCFIAATSLAEMIAELKRHHRRTGGTHWRSKEDPVGLLPRSG